MLTLGVFSITGNSFILLAVLVILVFAIAYGLFTVQGSGITPRPWSGSHGAPGAKGAEELSGKDQHEEDPFSSHGTDSKGSERDVRDAPIRGDDARGRNVRG